MEKRIISFDEATHTYKDERQKVYTSVTQLIGLLEPKYDDEFWAWYRALEQHGYKLRPHVKDRVIEINMGFTSKRFSIAQLNSGAVDVINTKNDVKKDWNTIKEEACLWGNDKHSYLEACIDKFTDTKKITIDIIPYSNVDIDFRFKVTNIKELEASPLQFTYPTIYNLIKHYVENGWVLYAEKRVYTPEHQVAGTIDLLLVKDNLCYIIDWKTNRKPLKFEAGYYRKVWNADRTKKIETDNWVKTDDRFLYPLSSVSHCKGSIYTLQLSSYLYICSLWGLKPTGTTLVHIRPKLDKEGNILRDNDGNRIEESPEFYNLPMWKNEAQLLFQWKKQQNAN